MIDSLGCFFLGPESKRQWTEKGDVDVVVLDKYGRTLRATVTHERMIITSEDE